MLMSKSLEEPRSAAHENEKSGYHEPFGVTSLPERISQGIHPVQIAQTKEDKLGIEGHGVIKTLVSSETSSSIFTSTVYETVLLTVIATSMVYTCNTTISLCKLMFHFHLRPG